MGRLPWWRMPRWSSRKKSLAPRPQQEMAIAADIQQRLMSVTVPDVPYAKVSAVSYPCIAIGGDFFDLVFTDNGCCR